MHSCMLSQVAQLFTAQVQRLRGVERANRSRPPGMRVRLPTDWGQPHAQGRPNGSGARQETRSRTASSVSLERRVSAYTTPRTNTTNADSTSAHPVVV